MRHLSVAGWLFLAALLGACDDSTQYRIDPLITTDTVELAVPTEANAQLPTALDVIAAAGVIGGGRFPERAADAEQWDFAVRVRNGQLVLLPAGVLGLNNRAALTRPLLGRTWEQVNEAPGQRSFFADSAVVLRVGEVIAVRSRLIPCGFGRDSQYGKVQPLSVDAANGRVRLQVLTNERCGDPRLALEG